MTSLQTQPLPRTTAPLAGSEQHFWREFADTGISYFKWAYGGTFLVGIAYYTLRLFQWLWTSGNFVGFAGASALFAAAIYGSYRLWRLKQRRVTSGASSKQAALRS